ncbi:MAG TPA: hypothetical protein VMJ66_03355 [Geobacteraceae bacterium]|nr:hypothetical protein [Geobacteraceae bacterium]
MRRVLKIAMMVLFFLIMFGLASCGSGGHTAAPAVTTTSLISHVGWYIDDIEPTLTNNGETCCLNIMVFYSRSIAATDIGVISLLSPNGRLWTIPASDFHSGTGSTGDPYLRVGVYNGSNPYSLPLAGTWTVGIVLNSGIIATYQLTLHEPGSKDAATHQYVYSKEDWTPATDTSNYVAALGQFPSAGYTVQYSGGNITTTGLSAVMTNYLATEPAAFNMYCFLYDVNQNLLGHTNMEYSTIDHTETGLLDSGGELSIQQVNTTSSSGGEVDLSQVKNIRIVFVDGGQYAPSSYSDFDYRSISSPIAVQ